MLKNENLISIIMPTYNAERYVRESIESIIKQTYCNWELLVIDDASTDSTQQIIDEYVHIDDRIKLIEGRKQGIGIGSLLNLGIEIARGSYIARMDADDISLPLRLEKQIEFMEKHSDIGVCATQYQVFSHNEIRQEKVCRVFTDQNIKAGMIFDNVIAHPTVMFRKKVFDDGWRYTENIIAEDYDLWTRMIPDIKFECLEDVLFYYRKENQNISLSMDLDKRVRADNRIIKTCITRLFKINPSDYCDNVFCGNGGYHHIDDMCEYLINQLELLNQIDAQNQQLKVLLSDSLRRSLEIRWKSLLDFIKISDDILIINNALFLKSLNELFEGSKNLHEYKSKIEEIREYFSKLIKTLKKAVIYGVGNRGQELFKKYLQLKEQKKINCESEVIIDKNVKNIIVDSKQYIVNAPEYLECLKPDFVLIFTTKYYEEVKSRLIDIGIDSKHILSGNILLFI